MIVQIININILSYFTPTINIIIFFIGYEIVCKNFNLTFDFFLLSKVYNPTPLVLSKFYDKGNRELYSYSICMEVKKKLK